MKITLLPVTFKESFSRKFVTLLISLARPLISSVLMFGKKFLFI